MGASPTTRPMAALLDRAALRLRRLRPSVLLAGLAVAIVAGYVALAGGALWREYNRTVDEAERNARTSARLVAGIVGYALEDATRALEQEGHRTPAPASLAATAVAGLPAGARQRLLDAIDLPGLGSVVIGLPDGTPVLRMPGPAAEPSAPDGAARLVVRQEVAGTGLVVSLTQSWSAILAGWRATTIEAALVGVAVATGVLMLTVALFAWMRRMQAVEEARRAAEAASRAKSDFLALMSHELRTPLNTVLGFAEMIRDRAWGSGAEDRYAEYAGDIHVAGTHLLSVLNDVLDLAKIEAGRMTLHPELLSAHDLAQACYRLSSGQARASGVEIAMTVTAAAPFYADPRAARQMIVNLLSNACKFSPAGGTVRLEIRDAPAPAGAGLGGGTLVTVSDSGVGMSPEGIVKALQRFGQVDNLLTRAQTGTGLGLPLVKGLMELHGGSLCIDSAPGRGTTVTLAFPPPPPSQPQATVPRGARQLAES